MLRATVRLKPADMAQQTVAVVGTGELYAVQMLCFGDDYTFG